MLRSWGSGAICALQPRLAWPKIRTRRMLAGEVTRHRSRARDRANGADFGNPVGGPLAMDEHQTSGRGFPDIRAAGRAGKRRSQRLQRAKRVQRIVHPAFRTGVPGGVFVVLQDVMTVRGAAASGRSAFSDGPRVSNSCAWILHRAWRRPGEAADFGGMGNISPADLLSAIGALVPVSRV